MRAVSAFITVVKKSLFAVLLMLAATSVIFFALRAAPGTAVDAYSSLNTPKEDLAQLRQDLGFTLLRPLERLGYDSDGASEPKLLDLVGAYEGNGDVSFEVSVELTSREVGVITVRWRSEGGPWQAITEATIGRRYDLSDGFGIVVLKAPSSSKPQRFKFGAVSLDERPVRAFVEWLKRVSVGDFGRSQIISQNTPVMRIAAPAFLKTFALAAGVLVCCMCLVSFVIILSPVRQRSSKIGALAALFGAAPSFVVGLFVMLVVNQVVGYYWDPEVYVPPKWWPLPKIFESEFIFAPSLFAGLAMLLGDGLISDYANGFRSDYMRLRAAPFIAAIRSKGANVGRHFLRNMVVPTADAFAGRMPLVLGSVIIVENMFGLTGGGWFLLEAAKERDVPLVVGLSVLFTGTGIALNLFADVVKTLIDPREADHGV